MDESAPASLLDLTADVVAAYVANNRLAASEVPGLITAVHEALGNAGGAVLPAEPERPSLTAAQIRKSIRPEGLVSFEDGRTYKSLKRHLTTRGLSVAGYRDKWGLPKDYPSVSPAYSAARSAIAKSLGLGQKGRAAKAAAKPGRKKS